MRGATIALITMLFSMMCGAATPVHKCTIGGKVTYQSDPCPSAQPRRTPSLQELNARQRERDEAARSAQGAPSASASASASAATDQRPKHAETTGSFKCDGRQYCSQMTSCAEAQLFLANCPGVKMDGDRNGIPCERQWCKR